MTATTIWFSFHVHAPCQRKLGRYYAPASSSRSSCRKLYRGRSYALAGGNGNDRTYQIRLRIVLEAILLTLDGLPTGQAGMLFTTERLAEWYNPRTQGLLEYS